MGSPCHSSIIVLERQGGSGIDAIWLECMQSGEHL